MVFSSRRFRSGLLLQRLNWQHKSTTECIIGWCIVSVIDEVHCPGYAQLLTVQLILDKTPQKPLMDCPDGGDNSSATNPQFCTISYWGSDNYPGWRMWMPSLVAAFQLLVFYLIIIIFHCLQSSSLLMIA